MDVKPLFSCSTRDNHPSPLPHFLPLDSLGQFLRITLNIYIYRGLLYTIDLPIQFNSKIVARVEFDERIFSRFPKVLKARYKNKRGRNCLFVRFVLFQFERSDGGTACKKLNILLRI